MLEQIEYRENFVKRKNLNLNNKVYWIVHKSTCTCNICMNVGKLPEMKGD